MHIAHPWVRRGAWLAAASALAALAALPARAADRSPAQSVAAAADPQAPVPATVYRPTIGYRVEAPAAASPDQAWQDSNAIVAGYNSMALTMKGMAGHQGHAMPAQAQPKAPPAPPSAHPPHHDHKESP